MKLRKILAGAAALAVTAAAFTTMASAELIEIPDVKGDNGLNIFDSSAASWMPIAYSNGERDASSKDVIDYGVDWSKAATIEVIFIVDNEDSNYSRDDWDGGFGGAIVLSSQADGNATHNWNAKDFWGVVDEDLELDTIDTSKSIQLEKIADYTYKAVCPVDDTNSVVDNAQLVQICIQDWSGVTWWAMRVDSMTVKDASGSTLIAWDKDGKCSLAPVGSAANAAAEAPAEEAPAPVEDTPAPAPATGDVAAAADSSKGSPDTGVADVAAVAGLAVVAAGALIVAKKSK